MRQATDTGATEVPSQVARDQSNMGQAETQACDDRATGTIVRGSILGSVMGAGGGATDLLGSIGLEVAPEVTGIVIIAVGAGIVVGSIITGIFQSSRC